MCHRGIGNEYYVKDRKFSIAELRIMIDAVQSAGFITMSCSQFYDGLLTKIKNDDKLSFGESPANL